MIFPPNGLTSALRRRIEKVEKIRLAKLANKHLMPSECSCEYVDKPIRCFVCDDNACLRGTLALTKDVIEDCPLCDACYKRYSEQGQTVALITKRILITYLVPNN